MRKLRSIIIGMILSTSIYAMDESVSLKYNWQPGMVSNVKYSFTKTKSYNGQTQKRQMVGTYVVKTSLHKDGLQLDFSDHKMEMNMDSDSQQNKLQQAIQKISQIMPSYIINKKGELIEVIGLEELKTAMEDQIREIFKNSPVEMQQKMDQLMQQILSKPQIMAQLQDEWNRDVGQWLGATFEKGYVYNIEFASPVPMLGNKSILTKGEYSYLGPSKCQDHDKDQKCVKLRFESYLDQNATTTVLNEMFGSMGVTSPEAFDLKADYKLEIITDPISLRPYKIKATNTVSSPVQGSTESVLQVDEKNYSFTYIK